MQLAFNGVHQKARRSKEKLLAAFSRVLKSGTFLEGSENQKLASALVRRLGGGRVITCASGHAALLLAIQALHLAPEDEVIIPANAYPTAFPVILAGAKLVLADVEENGQLDPVSLQQALTKRTRAVIAVHLYGLVGDIGAIGSICRKHRLTLIEDCAQAFGATWKGQLLGTLGDVSCFSFYPTKNLAALGDGGAVWTRNEEVDNFLKQAKSYGETVKYQSQFISGHSRLPELQAAGLSVYLASFNQDLVKRRKIFQWYQEALATSGLKNHLRLLTSHPASLPAPHLLVVAVDQRGKLRSYLASRDIPTLIHYPHPIHLVPAFSFLGKKPGDFPLSERLAARIISLPFHEYLTEKQVKYIINSIKPFFSLPP